VSAVQFRPQPPPQKTPIKSSVSSSPIWKKPRIKTWTKTRGRPFLVGEAAKAFACRPKIPDVPGMLGFKVPFPINPSRRNCMGTLWKTPFQTRQTLQRGWHHVLVSFTAWPCRGVPCGLAVAIGAWKVVLSRRAGWRLVGQSRAGFGGLQQVNALGEVRSSHYHCLLWQLLSELFERAIKVLPLSLNLQKPSMRGLVLGLGLWCWRKCLHPVQIL
jgi:hypothetical protein